ncbi:MAG: TetR/AcrR family transcriptional regulator [Sphaerochaetaceae bacterium]|nr:TetR/AcrR family transcriptional regulator [Sphaerochaetaceae bacterium]
MPKKIDHAKRKIEILYAALEVYASEGKDANLSLIASKCGLSRTTVYQYFKDEEDLYTYAVKYSTDVMFQRYTSDSWQSITDPVEKLQKITTDILDSAALYERQISNFIRTIEQVKDLPEILKHRTAKLELYFSRLIRQANKDGKMQAESPKDLAGKLVILLEGYLFNMVYLPDTKTQVREIISDLINLNKAR